jgi:hypothetical protein
MKKINNLYIALLIILILFLLGLFSNYLTNEKFDNEPTQHNAQILNVKKMMSNTLSSII